MSLDQYQNKPAAVPQVDITQSSACAISTAALMLQADAIRMAYIETALAGVASLRRAES